MFHNTNISIHFNVFKLINIKHVKDKYILGFCTFRETGLQENVVNYLPLIEQEEDEVPVLPPLYISEFVLEPNQLLFSPDMEEFQEGIAEVIKRFQDAVLSVQNLVPDTYFDAFTR